MDKSMEIGVDSPFATYFATYFKPTFIQKKKRSKTSFLSGPSEDKLEKGGWLAGWLPPPPSAKAIQQREDQQQNRGRESPM